MQDASRSVGRGRLRRGGGGPSSIALIRFASPLSVMVITLKRVCAYDAVPTMVAPACLPLQRS